MFRELIIEVDAITRMGIAATRGAGVVITAMPLPLIGVQPTTAGLTIHGLRRSITDGVGDPRRGMATTDLTSPPIRYIRRQHFG